MKEIVYLDTSYLHSFIAQIYGGLPANITKESQESRTQTNTDTKTEEETTEVYGSLDLLVAKAGSRIIPKTGTTESFSLAQLDVGKEIISKQLHDDALDHLIEHLKKENLLYETATPKIDGFVLLKKTFNTIDIAYLKTIMHKEFHSILGFTGGKGNKGNGFNPNEFMKILNFLSTILPSEFFIKQANFLSPLKTEYLREKSNELIFKYGNETEICLLGKVTKKIDLLDIVASPDTDSIFSINRIVSEAVDAFLKEMEIIEDGDYIVSPIAIFFE